MQQLTEPQIARIEGLLPPAPKPAANYVPVREAGELLFVAGQTPHVEGVLEIRGRVGEGVTVSDARELARVAALNSVAALRQHIGDLRLLAGIVSVTGFVACDPSFARHPHVIDGASDALVDLLGEIGAHARAAVGVQSLPDGAPVEISVVAVRHRR